MPTQDDIEWQWQLLVAYRRSLAHNLSRAAQYGGARLAPVDVINGIAESRAEIRRIKIILRRWSVVIEDHPDDEEPPHYSLPIIDNSNPQLLISDISPRFPEVNVPLVPFPELSYNVHPIETPALEPSVSSSDYSGSSSTGDDWSGIGLIFIIIIIGISFAVSTSSSPSKECTDTICFGQTIQGEINRAGEKAEYTFTAESGDKIIVIASRALDNPRQGALEPKINIDPKSPAELESSCAASDPLVARAKCTLTSTGTYTVTVADRQGEKTGMYRLFLQRLNNPGLATHLPFDQSATGELTTTGVLTTTAQRVTYTLTTTDTARLDIIVKRTSGDLEPQIQMFQPDGNLLLDCDGDDVENVEISCKPTVVGTYTILIYARNSGPTKGAYILKIARFKQLNT
jgi:hypothetical protein